MRLAFVLFHWFPHGGLQQDLVKVVNACAEFANCKVYCLSWQGPLPSNAVVEQVPLRGFNRVAQQQAFAQFVQQLKAQHDLVIGFNRLPGLDIYFAADSCFAHKAYNERSWWYRQTPRAKQQLAFERAVFADDSKTLALMLSQRQRQQFLQFYPASQARMLDLPPGIARKHQANAASATLRAQFRHQHGIPNESLVVLQIGSSFITKGLARSFAALTALPTELREQVFFLVLGHDKKMAAWQQRARKLGLGERVRFLAPTEQIPQLMQAADLLLHPSLHESAGMVILEAVVAGLPVLTTAECGYAQHVHAAQAGLVCEAPFQQQQLNTLLTQMLSSERKQWRANGIAYGQQHNLYDMPQVVAQLIRQCGQGQRVHE